ncbi:hypothetical protein NBH00_05225 [Paraconexibacter antarcticus]|uniref:Portal protein n=1 Tax=Paraconexibacter antarcticus TaxID=2949664 RepID=A0ABY5DXK1_9ACTN|nr:hypothetical protein [Paraconexibacter antarcticus]UTI65612.1 hypothetical protein NBH00_05225 [Paraconexibacter antarcticus]
MPQIDSTVADLDALLLAAESARRPFEPQVFLNLAFYTGDQWVAWDGTQVFEPELEDWRAKVVDNRIQPAVLTEVAKMTKERPNWEVLLNSQADEDISGARFAEMAMKDAWRTFDMARKLRGSVLASRVMTASYWKIWWDSSAGKSTKALVYADDHPQAGKVARAKSSGAPLRPDALGSMPPEMAAMLTPKTIAMGEIRVDPKNFFEIAVDPMATDEGIASAGYIVEKAVFSQDYCREHFSDFYDQLNFDQSPTAGIGKGRMAFSRFMGSGMATQHQAQGAEIREYWSKDKHTIWTKDGLLLLEEANPYPRLPYFMFRGRPVPGQFVPDCTVTQLIPRQISLNRIESQLEENAERIGNPPLLSPSSIDDEDFPWMGLPGEKVIYNDTGSPGAVPQFMRVPEMPGYIQNLVPSIEKSMMEISGQHEVSGANVPQGVTAASAIQLLQEADDTRLGPDISEMDNTLSEAGSMMLWLMDRFYNDERFLRVAGDEGMWDVQSFKGKMLNGHTQIQAQTGSGLPQSTAAKQAALSQLAMMFTQNGQAIPDRAWRKILAEYQIGGLDQFFANSTRDSRQVLEENRKMAQPDAEDLPINNYDNDDAHIEEHEDFQKTAQYSQLPLLNREIIETHVQAHRDRRGQLQAAQQQAGIPPAAGPPGAPAGSPPPPGPMPPS